MVIWKAYKLIKVIQLSWQTDKVNQVPATHVARVWQELDYRIDICRVTKCGNIELL